MTDEKKVLIAGLGEVGKPLMQVASERFDTVGIDILPVAVEGPVEVLHVCYPFQIPDFIGQTARYIDRYQPSLTLIHSTVSVGTTRAIAERTGTAVVNSPVRGKHARMVEELRRYTKFVGAMDSTSGAVAVRHLEAMGLKTRLLSSPEATELAKLTETTYFGLMIAWAQEVERYCDLAGQEYEEVAAFYDEIKFFPAVKYFPGIIGGHCVMPNIQILKHWTPSALLAAIEASNEMKTERQAKQQPAHRPEGIESDLKPCMAGL